MKQKKNQSNNPATSDPSSPVSIPTREKLAAYLNNEPSPVGLREIASAMGLEAKPEVVALRRRLKAMARDGEIHQTRGNRFGMAERMALISGTVLGHPDGYAFVRPTTGDGDIFLSPRESRHVLHGDRVLIRIDGFDKRGRPNGSIAEVLERANQQIVGRYFREKGVGFVTPDNRKINQDVLISDSGLRAKNGEFVVVKIQQQPTARRQPVGEIVEILGAHMAPGMEIEVAMRSYEIPVEWPEDVEAALPLVPKAVTADMFSGRRDLTELPFVTIDGADARDFDDAVYCAQTRDAYTLYVAIADVAHYVTPKSALDVSAKARGTSVYFPNQVIPMLPEALSNGICSLKPNVDRLALVCEMRFSHNGERQRTKFYNAVINSKARLIYDDVGSWCDGEILPEDDNNVRQHVLVLYQLYQELKRLRAQRGALEFDSPEPVFHFDESRKIESIVPRVRNDAHRMIEEAMIAANVAAAEYLIENDRATLFRVHARPDEEKISALREFLSGLGLQLGGGEMPTALDFAHVLEATRDRADARLISSVLLRGQKLAEYTANNGGHFGLALDAYVHFTSPIRRYPDLLVHRAIKERIQRRKQKPEFVDALAELGTHCSMTERRAEDATRDVIAWLKCEYMEDKVGQTFTGVISGVTSFGVFVELDNSFVEGLLHVTALPRDYYEFDAVRHCLRGRAADTIYRIGQTITVTVSRVSLDDRKIDFSLPMESSRQRKRKRRRA